MRDHEKSNAYIKQKFKGKIVDIAIFLDGKKTRKLLVLEFPTKLKSLHMLSISQLCVPDVDEAIAQASETEAGEERQHAIMQAEAEVLSTDAAIPLLHERVIQGEVAGVIDAARDPRERILVTAKTHLESK